MAHAKVAGGEAKRVVGKDVARPRSGAARQDYGINSFAFIECDLRTNQRRVRGRAVGIVSACHVHFNVAEAMFREMVL